MKFIEIASKYIIIGEENVPLTKCGNERMTIQVSELTDNARLLISKGDGSRIPKEDMFCFAE